jgi:hypothetical protein
MAYTNIYTQAHMPKRTLLCGETQARPLKRNPCPGTSTYVPVVEVAACCIPLGYRTGPLWHATTCYIIHIYTHKHTHMVV